MPILDAAAEHAQRLSDHFIGNFLSSRIALEHLPPMTDCQCGCCWGCVRFGLYDTAKKHAVSLAADAARVSQRWRLLHATNPLSEYFSSRSGRWCN